MPLRIKRLTVSTKNMEIFLYRQRFWDREVRKMKKRIFKIIALILVLIMTTPLNPNYISAAEKPSLNKKTMKLELGNGTKKLKLLNAAEGSTIAWKVKNKKKLGLELKNNDRTAVLTPNKSGNTVVTCVVVAPNKKVYTLECQVKIKNKEVPAKSVRISNAVIDETYNAHCLTEGESYKFEAETVSSIADEKCTDKIYWASSNKNIVKVGSKGKIVAVAPGTAKVTAYAGRTKEEALSSKIKKTVRIHVDASETRVDRVGLQHFKQLKIYFNKPMDADSIFNSGTKEILNSSVIIRPEKEAGIDAMEPGKLTASLSSDGKELSVFAENGFSGTYGITVTEKVKTKTGTSLKESFYQKAELKDTTGPIVTEVNTDESGTTCIVTFSEPIDISHMVVKDPEKTDKAPAYTPNWSGFFTTNSNYVLSNDKTRLLIDMSGLMEQDLNCEVRVKISGISDLVNNAASDGTGNAYITVGLITNTINKQEAKCTSVKRNGNSLVAVFDQPIHTPGIAIADSESLVGSVNPDNKKEVIYPLDSNLMAKKEIISVRLIGYSVFASSTAANEFNSNVNFGAARSATVIADSSFTTKTVNNVREKVLSLTFTNSISVGASTGSISAAKTLNGVVSPANDYAYKVSVDKKTMSLILTGSFTEQTKYDFTLPSGFFTDVYGNPNDRMVVSVTKTAGDSYPLPAPALIQLDSETKNKVYVTFRSMIDKESAEKVSNYNIPGCTITSARVMVNDDTNRSPAVVELTLAAPIKDLDIPYQVRISGISGYQGEYTEMADYNQMIKLGNNLNLTFTAVANSNSGQVVLTFDSDINASLSRINFAVETNSTRKFTIKGTPVVNGKTITISFNETVLKGDSITLLPLMDNMVFNMNNQQMLNVPVPVTAQ